MSEKVVLKALTCPSCGASLKAENERDAIVCVHCMNTIIPVSPMSETTHKEADEELKGALKIEGIKTPSSALAYMEFFFEEYDWETFAYIQAISIPEINKLAKYMRQTSADDKNTWLVCFNAAYVPFLKKIDGCNKLLEAVVNEYKEENDVDVYSKFDAYRRISAKVCESKYSVEESLEKFIAYAEKYGATKKELDGLKSDLNILKNAEAITVYDEVNEIPEIKIYLEERNAKIAQELAAEGIVAEDEYNRAKTLIDEKRYVEALSALISLRGYSDSKALIKKINRYYLISEVIEIAGNLYHYKKVNVQPAVYNLYATEDGKLSSRVIIKGISKVITNYADILYYVDTQNHLKKFDLSKKTEEKIYDKFLLNSNIRCYCGRAFISYVKGTSGPIKREVVQLDLATGEAKILLENIEEILSFEGNKIVYTVLSKKPEKTATGVEFKKLTNIINVDTMDTIELGDKTIEVEGFLSDSVVYTQVSPNEFNKNLYVKSFDSDEPERLIEKNIYDFFGIIEDKLFYYVGNAKNKSVININFDGSERQAWESYASKLLYSQGGWLYFIRRLGHNAIMCRSRMDGSQFSVIARDIDEYVDEKNGYMYYINSDSALVKVRMDGLNCKKLCYNVDKVLAVKEDKIIFLSEDDRIQTGILPQSPAKVVKSIYAVDFGGSGKIKLAYDVKSAEKYDENTVYYIAKEEIKSSYTKLVQNFEILYSLDVETNLSEKLLELKVAEKKTNMSIGFVIAMAIMGIAFFFGIISFAADGLGLGFFFLVAAIASFVTGLVLNGKKNE